MYVQVTPKRLCYSLHQFQKLHLIVKFNNDISIQTYNAYCVFVVGVTPSNTTTTSPAPGNIYIYSYSNIQSVYVLDK